jgi:hypothetical protein
MTLHSIYTLMLQIFSIDNNSEQTLTRQFDLYTTLKGVSIEKESGIMDLCRAASTKVEDVYVSVLDGTLFRNQSTPNEISTIVSNSGNMLRFVDQTKCTSVSQHCYSSCQNTCFFSVRFEIDPAGTERYTLKTCKSDDKTNCILISGGRRSEDPSLSSVNRVFLTHLPAGSYQAVFLNEFGIEVWPSFVTIKQEDSNCRIVSPSKVNISVPVLMNGQCSELVRNRFMEQSIGTMPTFWLHRFGGIEILSNAGVEGSKAIASISRESSGTMGQFLDNRCIKNQLGSYFEISVDIKLTRLDGSVSQCNPMVSKCPEVGIHTNARGFEAIAIVSSAINANGFQQAHGFIAIDNALVTSEEFFFYIRSNVMGMKLVVDNASMRPVLDKNIYCANLIRNSNLEAPGWQDIWRPVGSGSISNTSGFNSTTALRLSNRISKSDGISFVGMRKIEMACIVVGTSWTVSAQFKLIDKITGAGGSCSTRWSCPCLRIILRDMSGNQVFRSIVRDYETTTWVPGDFNLFKTSFTFLSNTTVVDVILDVTDYPFEFDLIVDDFSITRAL